MRGVVTGFQGACEFKAYVIVVAMQALRGEIGALGGFEEMIIL